MKYSWILFDADETLFRFDAYQGLRLMFSRFNVDFSVEDYQAYEAVNQPLWVDYQEGRITSRRLQEVRFEGWAQRLNMTACAINDAFVQAMTEICEPLPAPVNWCSPCGGGCGWASSPTALPPCRMSVCSALA